MKISRMSWAPVVALAAVACSTDVASEPSESSTETLVRTMNAEERAKVIEQFAQRVQSKLNVTIHPSDYEIVTSAGGAVIVKRERPGRVQVTDDGSGNPSTTIGLGIPTPEEFERERAAGLTVMQDGVAWREPQCEGRLYDKDGVGRMDICHQLGYVEYAGKTRNNWAWKFWGTCQPQAGGPTFLEMDECYIRLNPRADTHPGIVWNGWDPQSTARLPDCGDVTMGIGIGGFSISHAIQTCEKHVPNRGARAGAMEATWIGDAYWAEDVRGVGFLIGLGIPFDATQPQVYYDLNWGYKYSRCNLPPSVFDQCG